MLSINKKKYLKSLNNKKFRLIEKKILIDGLRIIKEGIKSGTIFEHIFISNKYNENQHKISKLLKELNQGNIPFTFISKKDTLSISTTKNSQGIFGLINISNFFNNNIKRFSNKIIILDKISDPGNLGTIIRTCAWFNIKSLILTNSSADIFNPKCIRAAMGGHFYIKDCIYLSYNEIVDFLTLNNYTSYCASMDGESLYDVVPLDKWALILGSEAHGIHDDLLIGKNITIPQLGKVESLNVSIASAIIINHLTKK